MWATTIRASCQEALPIALASKETRDMVVDIVRSELFENAVLEQVSSKRPASCPSKRALDKAVSENGACVASIAKKSLDPVLKKATQVWLLNVFCTR